MGRPKIPHVVLPPDTVRTCIHCKESKLIGQFVAKGSAVTGYLGSCKACWSKTESKRKKTPEYRERKNARSREYYRRPEVKRRVLAKSKARRRSDSVKHKFGLSIDDVNQMAESQCGLCAICNEPFIHTPYIDHDHSTGQVRNLLCRTCNFGLGLFRDNPTMLRSAIEYLMIHDK